MKVGIIALALSIGMAGAAHAATPAASDESAPATVDTRLYWDTYATQLDRLIDTRLYLVIWSLTDAKIDTLTNPGTLLFIR